MRTPPPAAMIMVGRRPAAIFSLICSEVCTKTQNCKHFPESLKNNLARHNRTNLLCTCICSPNKVTVEKFCDWHALISMLVTLRVRHKSSFQISQNSVNQLSDCRRDSPSGLHKINKYRCAVQFFTCLLRLSLPHDAPHGRRFQAVACGDVDGRCGIAENDANGRRKPAATLGAASSAFAES